LKTALVFAAAPVEPTPHLRSRLARLQQPVVIAADAGARTALAFGYTPDVVLGDFDSLDPSGLGLPVEAFPRDKDQTDGQLAIERALHYSPTELVLVGFLGGPRLDMAVANVLLLTGIEVPTVLLDGHNECRVLRGPADHEWAPEPTEIISLIPITPVVDGVTTSGLRWSLNDETLRQEETRGVSNEPLTKTARVVVARGSLLLTRHFPL
jgi:thiamine pyrophosphokinase